MKIEHKVEEWGSYGKGKDGWREVSIAEYLSVRFSGCSDRDGQFERLEGDVESNQKFMFFLAQKMVEAKILEFDEIQKYLGSYSEGDIKVNGKNIKWMSV